MIVPTDNLGDKFNTPYVAARCTLSRLLAEDIYDKYVSRSTATTLGHIDSDDVYCIYNSTFLALRNTV